VQTVNANVFEIKVNTAVESPQKDVDHSCCTGEKELSEPPTETKVVAIGGLYRSADGISDYFSQTAQGISPSRS